VTEPGHGNPQLYASLKTRIGWDVTAHREDGAPPISGIMLAPLPGFLLISQGRHGTLRYVPVRRCTDLEFTPPPAPPAPPVKRAVRARRGR
jgi:hypothetical protein